MRDHNAIPFGVRRRKPRSRRGVALLLVTVALGVAGAATSFYLTSRDNSSAIGVNATLAASAEWAAQSGAEMAVAIMQTQADWTPAATGGKLIDRTALCGATVSVVVTDLNGKPPTDKTRDLIVTSVATANGMTVSTQRIVSVQPAADVQDAIDPELGEFGAYATQSMQVEDQGAIDVWQASPDAAFGHTAKLGIGSTNASDLTLGSLASLRSVSLYVRDDSSAGLRSMVGGSRFVGGAALPIPIPAVSAALPSGFALAPLRQLVGFTMDGFMASGVIPPGRYQDYTLDNGAVGLLDGFSGPYYVFGNLDVTNSSALLIQGPALVEVTGNLTIEKLGCVELTNSDSSVTFYVHGDVTVDDAALGFVHDVARNPARSRADGATYRRSSVVRIWGVGSSAKNITLSHNALANMSVHAPNASVELRDTGSTLFGRVTSKTLRVRTGCALLVDPALDNRVGFTTRTGPLYKSDGTPIDGIVAAITSYDASQGCQSLGSTIASALPSLLDPLLNPLLGGGPAPATPRAAARATARFWPMRARAMERYNQNGTRCFSGSFAAPDLGGAVTYDQDQQEIDSKTTGGDHAQTPLVPG